ncbi:MAG: hypothetical protein ABIF01_03610, partial [Candidatus Micrarchaeota archaeon]
MMRQASKSIAANVPKRIESKEQSVLAYLKVLADKSGQDFGRIIGKIEERMDGARKAGRGEPLSGNIMKSEKAIVQSCRNELVELELFYEAVRAEMTKEIKELRASGGMGEEDYRRLTEIRLEVKKWFIRQEKRLSADYKERLKPFGEYEIKNRYAGYRIRKHMMCDIDETLTPANVSSMFDGLVEKSQEKIDEGYELSAATGKDRRYVVNLFKDPYATGLLIEKARQAKAASVSGDGESERAIELQMQKLISRGLAGLSSDLGLLSSRKDWDGLIETLGKRRAREWLPTDIHMVCECGCVVKSPGEPPKITVINGKTEFIPIESVTGGGELSDSMRKLKEQLEKLRDLRANLEALFHGGGVLLVDLSRDGAKIIQLQKLDELEGKGLPNVLSRKAKSQKPSEYLEVLMKGGLMGGQLVEPRPETLGHLQQLQEKHSQSKGVVVLVDRTFETAREIFERTGNLEELKELIHARKIGVTSDIALIGEHEKRGDLSGLFERLEQRQVTVVPCPAITCYEPNEIMYCPRSATYVDGDRITQSEELMVRALYSAVSQFISNNGGELDCVS